MKRNDEMRKPERERPRDEPDEAAEAELSERAVEPHQPTYPPASEVGETVEPTTEREAAVERELASEADEARRAERAREAAPGEENKTIQRVNDALHRVRPRGAEEG